ncbi:transposase [Micromonospora psammae]|uniref:transposase n=1 Tax=Micromonospora sp. CPCC 205556 TaxID=3122398 RepID=UPI003FA60BBD
MARQSKYPEEFRRQAAALVLDSGRTIRDVGRELGVNHETLRNWVAQLRQERDGGRPSDLAADERTELLRLRLRRQVAQLELEKEILKKPRSSSRARRSGTGPRCIGSSTRRRPPTRSVCSADSSASATAPSTSGCATAGNVPPTGNATTRPGPRSPGRPGQNTAASTAPDGSPPNCTSAVTAGTARR